HQLPNTDQAEVVDLEVEEILAHRDISIEEQQALQRAEVTCTPFKKPTRCVPLRELRLILGSQITQEDHAETIIDPKERMEWVGRMRDVANESSVYGQILR